MLKYDENSLLNEIDLLIVCSSKSKCHRLNKLVFCMRGRKLIAK